MPHDERSEQMVRNFFEAMTSGDHPKLRGILAHDATWHFPGPFPFCGTHVGRERIITDLLQSSAPYFTPGHLHIEMTALFSDGPRVVAEYIGRNLTRTGQPYENRYVFVFDLNNGTIENIRSYYDTDYMQRALA